MGKLNLLIVALILLAPIALALETKDVFDINDRQTKELRAYIDTKISAASDEAKKFTDNLFSTFDGKMRDLTRNFVIQSAILLFCAVLLANLISETIRNKHEKTLITLRYNILLNKEVDLKKRELAFTGLSIPISTPRMPASLEIEPVPPTPDKHDFTKALKGVM
jgi:hypothetical protein